MPGIKELLPSCLPRPCWVPPPGLLPRPYPSSTCNPPLVLLTFISKSLTEFTSSSPIPAAHGLSTNPGQPFPGLPQFPLSLPLCSPFHPAARGSFLKSDLCCSPDGLSKTHSSILPHSLPSNTGPLEFCPFLVLCFTHNALWFWNSFPPPASLR